MKVTYNDSVHMDTLLLEARMLLAEAADIAAGNKVRIVFYSEDAPPLVSVFPCRVARYARRAMGLPALMCEGPKLIFYTRGVAVRVLPTAEGYHALVQALSAHLRARLRRNKRLLAKCQRHLTGGPQP